MAKRNVTPYDPVATKQNSGDIMFTSRFTCVKSIWQITKKITVTTTIKNTFNSALPTRRQIASASATMENSNARSVAGGVG